MTVHLRPYHPDDCEAVVRLWYESWHHNFPDLYHPWTYAQWREHFQDKVTANASIWIAESAGQVAGFIVLREIDGCLDQIIVRLEPLQMKAWPMPGKPYTISLVPA